MAAGKESVRFRFSIARRPQYYLDLAEKYAGFCASRDARALAVDREGDGGRLKVWVECARKHRFWVAGRHLLTGTWCPECRQADSRSDALQQMQAVAAERKGRLLSEDYLNARTPLKWQCGNGHIWSASADNVYNKGSWCPECARENLFEARDRALSKRKRAVGRK